jgi:predicted RNase H-like HicB family nuclease
MIYRIEVEQEEDGRWIAEVLELAGAMAEMLEHGEAGPDLEGIAFRAA